jgi:hypothetical protein
MDIGTFVGKWHIQWTVGVEQKLLQKGWLLLIGTGSDFGDRAPFLTEEYAVCVGFAVIDPQDPSAPVQLSTDGQDGHQPLVLRLTGEQLRWKGYYGQQPLYIYISAAETLTPGGKTYVNLYGCTTHGDPDQVAIWGGSGTPPPPPEPGPEGAGNG